MSIFNATNNLNLLHFLNGVKAQEFISNQDETSLRSLTANFIAIPD
jgi:hypothetical protein